jgi:mannitol/fructose-specific phosphotransferase system IIA component (Ntr-type)
MPNSIRLSELISPATTRLALAARDRDGVLSELVGLVPNIEEQSGVRDTLLRAIHEREQLHSTGIGDGIALPHARNALVGLVDKPVIVFGRHERGIPFGAVDGKPAQLFFLLIAPTVTQHLAILARISRVLNDPRLRQALLKADRPEKAHALIKDAETKLYGA